MTIRVEVKTELLLWACQRAGLSEVDLLKRFPKLKSWLDGTKQPTLKQLEDFARKTHTPIGMLFLDEAPDNELPLPDFRVMGNRPMREPSSDLIDTIFDCEEKQDWYRTHVKTHKGVPLEFVGSLSIQDDIVESAAIIRDKIRFSLDERENLPNWTEAIKHFVNSIESINVLVMTSGVARANNYRVLDPSEFSGFALVDEYAPLIFINGQDTKSAQMFTLAHELAHIWIGSSGLSNLEVISEPVMDSERWCNQVAAELLVPLESIRGQFDPSEETLSEMDRLSKVYKVSTLVILRRIYDLELISQSEYRQLYKDELSKLTKLKRRQKSGGNFYNTLGVRMSKKFVRALVGSTLEGQTLFKDAFHMLSIKKYQTFCEVAQRFGYKYDLSS